MKKMSFVVAILVSAALAACHSKKASTMGNNEAGSGSAMGSDMGSATGSDMGSGSATGSDMGGSGSAM